MPLSFATPTPAAIPDLFLALAVFAMLGELDYGAASIHALIGARLLGLRVRTPAAFEGSIFCVNCGV